MCLSRCAHPRLHRWLHHAEPAPATRVLRSGGRDEEVAGGLGHRSHRGAGPAQPPDGLPSAVLAVCLKCRLLPSRSPASRWPAGPSNGGATWEPGHGGDTEGPAEAPTLPAEADPIHLALWPPTWASGQSGSRGATGPALGLTRCASSAGSEAPGPACASGAARRKEGRAGWTAVSTRRCGGCHKAEPGALTPEMGCFRPLSCCSSVNRGAV